MASAESTSSPLDQAHPSQHASTTSSVAPESHKPSEQFTNRLLIASGTAFVAGVFGSVWYQGRKTRQRGIHRAAVAASMASASSTVRPAASPLSSTSPDTLPRQRLQSLKDVKATEALIREGRLLGLKAFAIATALCLSGSAIIVGATRWALDVQTIPEFSAKMRDLFPKQRAKFVEAVVDADQAVFGGNKKQEDQNRQEHGTESSQDEEVDLDHEQDSNLLSRIERDLTKLAEEDP